LPNTQPRKSLFATGHNQHRLAATFLINGLFMLAALCLVVPQFAQAQAPEAAVGKKTAVAQSPESEVIFEGEGSFGHYTIFGYSWWSELYTGGVEYDRHTWGNFIGARMDYVAEALPVSILRQPAKTDAFGDPLTQTKETAYGVALSPIGLRMMWRSNKTIKPYFIAKGGIIFFDKKALSQDASYGNLLLQLGIGTQFRLTKKLDLRVGYADIHFSDAFVVPSNPGLDSMTYNGGICYHLGK
jgi:opacity protein-like surface antigen